MSTLIPYAADQVGHRVRALRLAFGFETQDSFAKEIGAQKGEVGAWESGGRRPSVAKAMPMVKRFNVTLDWLFLGDPRGLPYATALRLGEAEPAPAREGRG